MGKLRVLGLLTPHRGTERAGCSGAAMRHPSVCSLKPAGLAQWLARSLSKRKVRGSIPAAGTSLVIVKKP